MALPPPSPSEALGNRHLTCLFSQSAPQPCATETPNPLDRRLRRALDRLPTICDSFSRCDGRMPSTFASSGRMAGDSAAATSSGDSILPGPNRQSRHPRWLDHPPTSAPCWVPLVMSALRCRMLLGQFRILQSIRFSWLRRLLTSPWSFPAWVRPRFAPKAAMGPAHRRNRRPVSRFGTMAWAVSSLLALNSFLPPISTNTFRQRFGARFRPLPARDSGKNPRDRPADLAHLDQASGTLIFYALTITNTFWGPIWSRFRDFSARHRQLFARDHSRATLARLHYWAEMAVPMLSSGVPRSRLAGANGSAACFNLGCYRIRLRRKVHRPQVAGKTFRRCSSPRQGGRRCWQSSPLRSLPAPRSRRCSRSQP